MAKIKGIYMADIEWRDGSTWKPVRPSDGVNEIDMTQKLVMLYYDPNTPPAEGNVNMSGAFNGVEVMLIDRSTKAITSPFTLFHPLGNGIPEDARSPIIRYKIVVGTYTTEEVLTANPSWFYMMMNSSFSADPWTGNGNMTTTTNSLVNATLKLWVPSFTTSQIGSQTPVDLQTALLQDKTRWKITSARSGGSTVTCTPTNVVARAPDPLSATDYGIAKRLVTLTCQLQFPVSGVYTITATFSSNDEGADFTIPGGISVTATIVVNTGTPANPFIMSFDQAAILQITIA